ncbi:substrate-binding periplasmic protein [Terasakiella sp. A23]|uniref:substrate-binding periplasmic protein n=1 Tax=Terasakiella sp. FCG-A23 TaxID=3080561 RepID=UPI0029538C5D|nr:transporter substrate-binding domain-containing protein [Terasakiella sp. A23]
MGVGLSIPPYVIKEENRGIEFDILKEVLASQGYKMQPVYVPLGRTLHLIQHGKVDGIMSTGRDDLPGCYTDTHITYWNFAITLKKKGLKIDTVWDLQDKTVLSFQNAKHYLGPKFHEMALTNKLYREIADQSVQNKLLFTGRTDVVVADRYIFEWYRNDETVTQVTDTTQEVTHHRLFDPSHFSAVFKDEAVCKAFNVGLKKMRDSGRYDEIIASYNVGDPELLN